MTKPFYRCTFEWDESTKKDSRGDMQYVRHICKLPMHHTGSHSSEPKVITKKRRWKRK